MDHTRETITPTYASAVVLTPGGREATIPVADEHDWKDRYQWRFGVWPDDDRLVRIER
jgi:hypothetical protein